MDREEHLENLRQNHNNVGFSGNPNLKRVGEIINFTQEQFDEYKKCMADPIYFIKNYVKIIHIDRGLIPFELFDYQEKMIRILHENRFVIGKQARQSGKSSCVIAFFLWLVLFNDYKTIAILANKGELARELLGRLELAYEHLPLWLQQGVMTWNKGSIELENGSRIIASSTTSSSVRGYSFTEILLDEFAHVPTNIAEQFFASVYPTISSGLNSKLFVISTPLGLNHYYKMWMDAERKKSLFVPYEVFWHQVPGRDQKWKEENIRNTSEMQFAAEQECQFLGSTNTLISAAKLKSMVALDPVSSSDGMDVYEHEQPGHTYIMTVDPSRGQGLDYQACMIIDCTTFPYKMVAKYRRNDIQSLLFPTFIASMGMKYNDAFILVEISDNGQQICDILNYELEYENIIRVAIKGKQGQMVTQGMGASGGSGGVRRVQFGLKQSTATKRIGCSNLKTLIENDKLILCDEDTILELKTFVANRDSFAAEEGAHDDLAMALVLFSWLVAQRTFKDTLGNDIRKAIQEDQMAIDDEMMTPELIIDNGIDFPEDQEDWERREGWSPATPNYNYYVPRNHPDYIDSTNYWDRLDTLP